VYTVLHQNDEAKEMATGSTNAKSQSVTARIPHDVMEGMEIVKQGGESNAAFIVSAMQGEIARRQLKERGEEKLLSNLNGALTALERIEEIGAQAGEQLREIVGIARGEATKLKGKK
jgi:outer membrane receptor for monomeric catechols